MSTLQSLAAAWGGWMLPMSLQIALLALAVAVIERGLTRWAWPQQRALLWSVVLVRLVIPPGLTAPALPLRLIPGSLPATIPAEGATGTTVGILVTAAFLIWLVGALALTVFGTIGYRARLRGILRTQEEVPARLEHCAAEAARRLGLSRVPTLLVCRSLSSPAVVGFVRPRVVLPARLVSETQDRPLVHILMHELAHVRRRDPLSSLLCVIFQLVYWFHPLVWLTCGRLNALREESCDRAVAESLAGPTAAYTRTLLGVAGRMLEEEAPSAGVLAFIRPRRGLRNRVAQLDRFSDRFRLARRISMTAVLGLVALLGLALTPAVAVDVVSAPGEPTGAGCMLLRYRVMAEMARTRGYVIHNSNEDSEGASE